MMTKRRFNTIPILSVMMLGFLPGSVHAECEESAGERQYNKCLSCHSTKADDHLTGPSLHGLMGRQVGSVEGFNFSPAMEEAGFIWSTTSLSYFLANPMDYVPGTVMPFGGIKKDDQRSALVCYIESLN